MAGKREENPAGSWNNLRGDVLRVLGVLKVATVEQIQQISAPHLSYRHTDKPTPSKRKQARTASHTGALSDLRKHGLVENGGQLPGGDRLRNLTPMGLKAAARELGRPVGEMGDPARGAGRTGASHPMTVNEAVLALLRPKPDLAQLTGEPADVLAAARAAVDAPNGLGTIASYATEVALPATGTWSNPGKGGAQADIVITAPEDGVPLLFVEIDNCFESAQVLAAKIDKYMRFCQRKVKDVDGTERPMWRTRWWVPDGRHGDQPHPPLLLVFNRVGPRNPDTVIAQLTELTKRHWQGTAYDGFHMYDGKLPIVVTGMKHLQEHGSAGAIFRRFGRPQNQTLLEAIGNPRREAHDARKQAEYAARQREHKEQLRRAAEQQRAEREARRPVCAGCGTKFTDERWKAIEPARWDAPWETHPHLCDDCKARAITAERQAEQAAHGHQEYDQAVPEQRAEGGWLSRFRPGSG
ncbi:replication-relaxation family protein [Streptomyces pseudogriseolus]|uniref:replication-relaxation family protein n=1 Tax=Streptomyces pseudogriseolus TaxID=36817 RepID=UPI003FA1F209